MLKKLLLSLCVLSLMAPAAFADATEDLTTTVEEDSVLAPDYYYETDGTYFTVSTTTEVEADAVYVYGSYVVENAATRREAILETRDAYKSLQSDLSGYGSLRRTGIYAYADWEYTNLYDASLSVRIKLSDPSDLTEVEDLMYEAGFDNWFEAIVEDTTSAESAVTSVLTKLIDAKKEVYEAVLGYKLGDADGLTIYSWPDSTSFNEATGMVDVMVSASVWYYAE